MSQRPARSWACRTTRSTATNRRSMTVGLKPCLKGPGASPIWPIACQAIEDAVIKNAADFPAYGQARTCNELRKLGVFVSPSGVRSIWLRHDLANFKARLKSLEAKVAKEGTILTEAQVQALIKNTVAFINTSLSSLRMRFSRRSRSFSLARSKSSFDIMSVSRCTVIHLFSIDMPTPRSSANCFRVSPLVNAIRTTSWRNSSVRLSPVVSLLCYSKCYQRSDIKPRQVQLLADAMLDNGVLKDLLGKS